MRSRRAFRLSTKSLFFVQHFKTKRRLKLENTLIEKNNFNMFPEEMRQHVSSYSLSYQEKLSIIQADLQILYGERANWRKCLDAYYHSSEYNESCHDTATIMDAMPLNKERLKEMLEEEAIFHEKLNTLHEIVEEINKSDGQEKNALLKQAAILLGIWPERNESEIFHWLVLRDNITLIEKEQLISTLHEKMNVLGVIIDLISELFTEGGVQLTFPHAGVGKPITSMTQRMGKYFYRGENALYPNSKPSIYRTSTENDITLVRDHLILNEAYLFLRQFDAVNSWPESEISTVNHMALAQHYGIKTPMLDITSDLKTALFFACCKFEGNKWLPLSKNDFYTEKARPDTSDARYGILYRFPTEIAAIQWAISKDSLGYESIVPIGYQPFMRCSAQHGYMLIAKNSHYDIQKDPSFDKFLIELSTPLCKKIFDTMDQGRKVYPLDDIPHIDQYLNTLKCTDTVSKTAFEHYKREKYLLPAAESQLIDALKEVSFFIKDEMPVFISKDALKKINLQYNAYYAVNKLGDTPKSRLMFKIGGSY